MADPWEGNANKHVEQAPPPPELGTPTLKSKTFTTGRGGTGNMAVNDPEHPELARERQDLDVPLVALAAEKDYAIGRGRKNPTRRRRVLSSFLTPKSGGAGNVHHLTAGQRAEAKEHNQHVRANSMGRPTSKDGAYLRELAEKSKEKLFGRKEVKS